MSGFVSELMVFVGFATDDAYSLAFRIVIDGLAAVGVVLTPIYLLSMLREIFFGKENPQLADTELVDAEPREIYIISCLLVPIIGIGLYPRLVTDTYRATIEQVVARDRVEGVVRVVRLVVDRQLLPHERARRAGGRGGGEGRTLLLSLHAPRYARWKFSQPEAPSAQSGARQG